ncbi:MAG: hypothetical protein J7521_08255 [Caulobacter sp.]|nr:hypothetical protein [Caulobacter sp.]
MNKTDITAWGQALQAKLMAALDAAWAIFEASDDPEPLRRASERVRFCGQLAAMARKVALMTPPPRARPALAGGGEPAAAQAEPARRALDRLKSGRARL